MVGRKIDGTSGWANSVCFCWYTTLMSKRASSGPSDGVWRLRKDRGSSSIAFAHAATFESSARGEAASANT